MHAKNNLLTAPHSDKPRHRFSKQLLLAIVATAIGVLAAELVLHRAGVRDRRVQSRYRTPHPVFGWAPESGASYVNPLPEEQVHVAYNSKGWRDLERDIEKPEGTFRIAVLGDSFMEGYSVNFEESFHRLLEDALDGRSRDVEVLNFGVGGYGTLQEYLVYREAVSKYSPDLVLLGFCMGNDLRNNSRELESKLGAGKFKTVARPFLEASTDAWRVAETDNEAAQRRYQRALKERRSILSRIYQSSSVLQLLRGAAANLLRTRIGETSADDMDLAMTGVHYCEEPPEIADAWDTTSRILVRLRDEVAADGADLVVFSVPSRHEVNRSYMHRVRSDSTNPDRLCLDAAPGFDRLDSVLEELGIVGVELLDDFRREAAEEELFRRSDQHWNSRAHETAVSAVKASLDQWGLVPRQAN